MIVNSSMGTFPSDFLSDGLTIIDFWAIWCGPCKAYEPIMEESSQNHPNIKYLKVNVDEELELSRLFEISSIPTTVFIRDGFLVGVIPGAQSKSRLEELIIQSQTLNMDMVRNEGRSISDLLNS